MIDAGSLSASFVQLPNGRIAIICRGHFPARALPLVARVGDVDVEGIDISPDGRGFCGLLPRSPNAGDELVVRYLPEPPTRTNIRFPPRTVA